MAGAGRVADKRNAKGETALHAACARGDAGRVADLLRRGANPNTKDHAGSTPLVAASNLLALVSIRFL